MDVLEGVPPCAVSLKVCCGLEEVGVLEGRNRSPFASGEPTAGCDIGAGNFVCRELRLFRVELTASFSVGTDGFVAGD